MLFTLTQMGCIDYVKIFVFVGVKKKIKILKTQDRAASFPSFTQVQKIGMNAVKSYTVTYTAYLTKM